MDGLSPPLGSPPPPSWGEGGGKSVGRQARREIAGKQPHPSTFLQPFFLREGLFCTTYCSSNNNSKMEASVGTCEHLNGPLLSLSLLFEPFLCSDDDDDTYLTPPKRKEEEKRLPRGRGRMGSHASFLLLLSKERRRQFATGEGSEETISEPRWLERPFSSSEKVCSPWVSFFFFWKAKKIPLTQATPFFNIEHCLVVNFGSSWAEERRVFTGYDGLACLLHFEAPYSTGGRRCSAPCSKIHAEKGK